MALHHVAVFPPAGVGVRGVHAEAGSGAAVALDKGDVSAVRRLSELEVDTVALHALVVVEAQDEGVDCLVQREASEGAVHGDADFVAYRPVAGPGASCAHGLDGGWVVVGQRFAGQADGGGADRAGRAVWLVPAATETVIFAVPLALPVTVMVVPERLASATAVLSTDTEIAPFPALVTAMVF